MARTDSQGHEPEVMPPARAHALWLAAAGAAGVVAVIAVALAMGGASVIGPAIAILLVTLVLGWLPSVLTRGPVRLSRWVLPAMGGSMGRMLLALGAGLGVDIATDLPRTALWLSLAAGLCVVLIIETAGLIVLVQGLIRRAHRVTEGSGVSHA